MHAFDGQTDGQTDEQTDGQTDRNLIVKTALHSMQRGKNLSLFGWRCWVLISYQPWMGVKPFTLRLAPLREKFALDIIWFNSAYIWIMKSCRSTVGFRHSLSLLHYSGTYRLDYSHGLLFLFWMMRFVEFLTDGTATRQAFFNEACRIVWGSCTFWHLFSST